MSLLNKSDNFMADVTQHLENPDNLDLRSFRKHQIEVENFFWAMVVSSYKKTILKGPELKTDFIKNLELTFLYTFFRIESTLDIYKGYFNRLFRSVWEKNKKEVGEYFTDLAVQRKLNLESLLTGIHGNIIERTKIKPLTKLTQVPIDKYDKYEQRLERPLSDIFRTKLFNLHIRGAENHETVSIDFVVDRKLVRKLHSEMMEVSRQNLCISVYQDVFLPFLQNENLPYYKIK